jgi:hypothetical protein
MASTSLFPLVGWIRFLWHETFEVRTILCNRFLQPLR